MGGRDYEPAAGCLCLKPKPVQLTQSSVLGLNLVSMSQHCTPGATAHKRPIASRSSSAQATTAAASRLRTLPGRSAACAPALRAAGGRAHVHASHDTRHTNGLFP